VIRSINSTAHLHRRLLGLAIAVGPLAPGLAAKADSLYTANFNAVGQQALSHSEAGKSESLATLLPGWSVIDNNTAEKNAIIADATISGAHPALGAYLATGDGASFNLAIYDNAGNASTTDSISYTYTNTTSATLANLGGQFDYVAAWSRNASHIYGDEALTGGFEQGMQYALSGGGPSGNLANTKWTVTNTNGNLTRSIADATWLTDTQMNNWGLSERDVQFTIPGVLLPGQSLTLKWVESGSSTDFMAKGIENFQLDDNLGGPGSNGGSDPIAPPAAVPAPGTLPATLVGTALLTGLLLARRRRQMAV